MDQCPYCGSTAGYYTKDYIYGSSWFNYSFDGSYADNSCMYDCLTRRPGRVAYCQECGKRLFKIEEMDK